MNAHRRFLEGYVAVYRRSLVRLTMAETAFLSAAAVSSYLIAFLAFSRMVSFTAAGWVAARIVLGCAALLPVAAALLRTRALRTLPDERLAVRLDRTFPDIENRLINAWQLSADPPAAARPFVERLLGEAAERVGGRPPEAALDNRRLASFRRLAAGTALALACFAAILPRFSADSVLRLLAFTSLDASGIRVEPGDAEVETGGELVVRAWPLELEAPTVETRGGEALRAPLERDRTSWYRVFPEVRRDFSYRIVSGARKTGWFSVAVRQQTAVRSMTVTCDYPGYTALKRSVETRPYGAVSALVGTRVTMTFLYNNPVGDARLLLGTDASAVSRGRSEKKTFSFTLRDSTIYRVRYHDPVSRRWRETPTERVTAAFDQVPFVEFIEPGRDLRAVPGAAIPVKVKVADDFGVRNVRFRLHRGEGGPAPADPVFFQTGAGNRKDLLLASALRVPVPFGERIAYYAECVDTAPTANTGRSPLYYIHPMAGAGARNPDPAEKRGENELETRIDRLRKALEQFMAEERKIVEAAKKLTQAKDLTGKNDPAPLAEAQREWAQTFQKMVDDLNRLAKQTQGKFSLADELVEMISHLQSSVAGLRKEAILMAIAESHMGLELAKEITSNLERWMSETPDNLKWDMAEPTKEYEVPEAALPDELEDIIGELLDQEEDMKEEVEDITSSWMDSLDKGAGWGALDGPISNMSAKGITGNMMPNQQEIGGRSGEGRTGRSYGEMVEKTAQGKGGRKTPARLTPDNMEPGDIQDTSKDAPLGPTGGGKTSGWGAEGLRGPTQDLTFRYDMLAKKQAQIIEQAEKLSRELQVLNVPNVQVEQAISAMKEFRLQISEGRYGGLLTSKDRIISQLQQAHQTVAKQAILRVDPGERAARSARDAGSIWDDRIPTGYEALVRRYYEKIAGR